MAMKLNHLHQTRTFIAARVKWVPDPYLDAAVALEKDLKEALYLKDGIFSTPTKSVSINAISPLKSHLRLHQTAAAFFKKHPFFFRQYQPSHSSPLRVKLTPLAVALHKEEQEIYDSPHHRYDDVKRLAKLLMLAGAWRLPVHVVDMFRFDLGLPSGYFTRILSEYPDYFLVTEGIDHLTGKETLFLELVSWRDELAVSSVEDRAGSRDRGMRMIKGKPTRVGFPVTLPRGNILSKRVKDWMCYFQELPYVSPYENASHMEGDEAEKWTVAVLHELLWIMVSKKTEKLNVLLLGDYLGFGDGFKNAIKHYPWMFYVSNKIRTQTLVLREAYRKNFLVEKHPIMSMRFRYISLLNKVNRN